MEAAGSLGTRCGCQPAPWELSQNQMPVGVGGGLRREVDTKDCPLCGLKTCLHIARFHAAACYKNLDDPNSFKILRNSHPALLVMMSDGLIGFWDWTREAGEGAQQIRWSERAPAASVANVGSLERPVHSV